MRRNSRGTSSYPSVAVIILNFNGLKWLPLCLSSVLKTEYPNYEVILVDNASSDGSIEYVRREFASVKIVKNSANLGFAEAYNMALDQVEADYVALLNNDSEVLNPKWLTSLVEAADSGMNVGAVASKMVSMREHGLLDSVGGAGIPYWRGGFFDIGRGETDVGQYSEGFEPFAYCGGAALIRKSTFIDAGKLDSKFFTQYDDLDLSWRLRLRGWRIAYAPDAEIAHYRGGTLAAGEVTPTILYYCNRNFLRAIIKNCGASLSWALRSYLLYTFLIASVFLILEPIKSFMLIKGVVWNLRNLRSSYAARQMVQSRRKVGEAEILRRMYREIMRKRTSKHITLTRIMDTLFDLSKRAKFQAMITA
jgi:GT2 family glycosyltransferase